MKLRYLSDIHFEHHADGGKAFVDSLPVDCDALVLAGDIGVAQGGSLLKGMRLILERFAGIQVLYVPGNHEFYRDGRERTFENSDQARRKGQETVREVCDRLRKFPNFLGGVDPWNTQLYGQHFVGATMWFGSPSPSAPYGFMNDYSCIAGFSQWEREESERHVAYLRRVVCDHSIVITHHLPSPDAVDPKWKMSALNAFFVHPDAHEIIERNRPKAWIHGHSHEAWAGRIGQTAMRRNPYGYHGHELVRGFNRHAYLDTFDTRLGGLNNPDVATEFAGRKRGLV